MFFDRVWLRSLRHQIHIVASADVTREAPKVAYQRAVKDIERIEKKLAAGWKPAYWRRPAHPVKAGKVEVEDARAHFEAKIPGKRPPSQGVHHRRRHLPGRAFAALGFRARSGSARSLPFAAHGESFALHVFPALRRRPERKQEKFRRNARARLVSRNAGACRRTQARIPADCRHASPWARRSRRRGARTENAHRRERTRRARDAGRSRAATTLAV